MPKYKKVEILSIEDRSKGMSSAKLYLITFKCYHNKQYVTKKIWITGRNETDCRQKFISEYTVS